MLCGVLDRSKSRLMRKPHRRCLLIDQGWLQSADPMEPCIRCRAKGIVVCPECQGTGEKRNDSYVVTGRCGHCEEGGQGVHNLSRLPG